LASLARTLILVCLATRCQMTIKAALLWVSLAITTHCRSIPTHTHHLLFASVPLTRVPTDDPLPQVMKHSAACFSIPLAVTLYVLFISLFSSFCSTIDQQYLFGDRRYSLGYQHYLCRLTSDSLNDSIDRLLLMIYSLFIGFVLTVRLVGEYCSELTHHDITLELINIDELSLYIMHAV
uniref:Uncharacterized protein n=1 Tax=Amphimedon queenslandica TaxID=400682 RepID=A0A1X7UAG9_AMPQE